jgi:hypothetical protein
MKNSVFRGKVFFTVLSFLLPFPFAVANGAIADVIPFANRRLLQVNNPFSTLVVVYDVESSSDNGRTWRVVEKNQLFWDLEKRKYHFIKNKIDKKEGDFYPSEFYCEEDKWTLLFKKVGSDSKSVTITKAGTCPFYFPFSFLSKFDRSYSTLKMRNLQEAKIQGEKKDSIALGFLTEGEKKNVYVQDVFVFQKATGLFIEKKTEIVDEKGTVLSKLGEYTVPDVEYYNVNGSFFPKRLLYKEYGDSPNFFHLKRYTFSDVKINQEIPQQRFVAALPVGYQVLDTLKNKTYIVTEKSALTEDELTAKQLDELFEKANK